VKERESVYFLFNNNNNNNNDYLIFRRGVCVYVIYLWKSTSDM